MVLQRRSVILEMRKVLSPYIFNSERLTLCSMKDIILLYHVLSDELSVLTHKDLHNKEELK